MKTVSLIMTAAMGVLLASGPGLARALAEEPVVEVHADPAALASAAELRKERDELRSARQEVDSARRSSGDRSEGRREMAAQLRRDRDELRRTIEEPSREGRSERSLRPEVRDARQELRDARQEAREARQEARQLTHDLRARLAEAR